MLPPNVVSLLMPVRAASSAGKPLIPVVFFCPLQTLMYTAITYPMLQLEWTAAKVFWYLLMQVTPKQPSNACVFETFLYAASCYTVAPLLCFCVLSQHRRTSENSCVCASQFTCLQYMTNFGALTIAITPNEQAGSHSPAACLAVCLAMKGAE